MGYDHGRYDQIEEIICYALACGAQEQKYVRNGARRTAENNMTVVERKHCDIQTWCAILLSR